MPGFTDAPPLRWSVGLATFACALAVGMAPLSAQPTTTKGSKMNQPAIDRRVFVYPKTPAKPVTDRYHGETAIDEYRWLEDGEAPAVKRWMRSQNALTREALDALPARGVFKARLQTLLAAPRQEAPVHRGPHYFFKRQDGTLPQAVLMVQEGLASAARTLIDPNLLRKDGTVSLDWWEASPDGAYVAYGLSEGGNEQSVLHVVDARTGRQLPDVIQGCRYASVAWLSDQSGFYYTRFPPGGATGEVKQRAYYHQLGADVGADAKIYEHPGGPEMIMFAQLSKDDRYLLLTVNKGSSSTNEIHMMDRRTTTDRSPKFTPIISGFNAQYYGDIGGHTLYLRTNEGAPRGKVLAVDLHDPRRDQWKEVIAQAEDPLQGAFLAGENCLVAEYLHNAVSQVRLFDLQGKSSGTIAFPGLGTVSGLTGWVGDDDLFFTYTSFLEPAMVYQYKIGKGQLRPFFKPDLHIEAGAFEERQVWYTSKDGTRVPMFLVHKKGVKRNGKNPTVLTGYGGFDISITPSFSAADYVWLERGGVLAVANLRGGGEFGSAWHEGGTLGRKQNVFDDFIGAAEWLVKEKVTSPERLAIEGGSNGGLLVGAVMTQRPELFKAVVCAVPLLDMLRYHKFLIAKYWIPEYGSSDDADQYRFLKAYSPYQHVNNGTAYPSTLIVTGESDTRVDPLHARKMAARLQRAQHGHQPIFLYVESKAGHGAGKPLTKRVETASDTLGFLAWQLGL